MGVWVIFFLFENSNSCMVGAMSLTAAKSSGEGGDTYMGLVL